jgi:hypothetical protein
VKHRDAVDRDRPALASLTRQKVEAGVEVIPVIGDFTGPFDLPGLEKQLLDGVLLGNALHFVSDPGEVLGRLASAQWPVLAGRAPMTAAMLRRFS